MVTIELYGVARLRAGREVIEVDARSLGDALVALGAACPALERVIVAGGRLAPGWLVALNGAQITADLATPLGEGDVVVLVSADAGG
ncbi:MoaD/ThiS family protein [Polyangium sp. y55x31]|uniref:MoaD/ThiS family protein n=1 Tax=Polyangium sp. y55x31 TaxID=3042688 RepID=UPI00248323AA|nr:MoaD/ThiS family protein [Polyangium sp. y55x31]MDI1484217.1 MoaD/ThiS family protein [Polyangium sp. y55x31]